jgi:type IV pilus assembly protein PilW
MRTNPDMTMPTLRRQAGLSLIELMVAITIGLFLLVGLVSVFATSNQTYMDLGRASQQIENGRFAMQVLVDDIGHAGFYGRYSSTPAMPGAADPCVNNNMANLLTATALPIQGYDSPGATPIVACLPAANFVAGRDIIVVRRVDSTLAAGDDTTIPNGKLTANNIYMQSNADSTTPPIIGVATGVSANDQATFSLKNKDTNYYAPIRRYHVHIYFIAPCSVPAGGGSVCTGGADDNGRPIPTLKRIELTANGTMTVVPLVEGIENLQVDYGVDANKDGVPDGPYVTSPAFADWNNVVAVRISVLSRQIEPSSDYVDTKTYDMGAAGMLAGSPANFKRHVYNAVIRINNPAARRES